MIRVTIEKVPKGYESQKRTMAVIEIVNDTTGLPSSGNYYALMSRVSDRGKVLGTWKVVTATGFPRRRLTVYDLLFRVLREAVGGRN